MNSFQKALTAILEAETIYVYGIGASGLVAQDLQQKLIRIKKKCMFFADYHVAMQSSLFVTEKDVVIAFSYSGNSKEVNCAVESAKKNGAICIGITSCGMGKLHNIVDIALDIPRIEKDIRMGAIQSRYSQLFIIDLLFFCITQENIEQNHKNIIESRAIIDKV